eukprot:4032402-Amphidinium_carterae.2
MRLVSEGKLSLDDGVEQFVDPILANIAKQDPTQQNVSSLADLFGAEHASQVQTLNGVLRYEMSRMEGVSPLHTHSVERTSSVGASGTGLGA